MMETLEYLNNSLGLRKPLTKNDMGLMVEVRECLEAMEGYAESYSDTLEKKVTELEALLKTQNEIHIEILADKALKFKENLELKQKVRVLKQCLMMHHTERMNLCTGGFVVYKGDVKHTTDKLLLP